MSTVESGECQVIERASGFEVKRLSWATLRGTMLSPPWKLVASCPTRDAAEAAARLLNERSPLTTAAG